MKKYLLALPLLLMGFNSNAQSSFNICDDGHKYINYEITMTGFYSKYQNESRQLRDWTGEGDYSESLGFTTGNDIYYTRILKSNSGCNIIIRIPKKLSYDKIVPNIDSGEYVSVKGILIKSNVIQITTISR
jgi:hypothetical protein